MNKVWVSTFSIIVLIAYIFAPSYSTSSMLTRLDSIALILLILAVLPWLSLFVTEVEVFGVKAKMREVDRKADAAIREAQEAIEAAAEARKAAKEASAAALEASNAASNTRELTEGLYSLTREEAKVSPPDLETLARQYIVTRNDMEPGSTRTAKMTEIFTDMQQVAQVAGRGSVNVSQWMESDAGLQLAAIAYLRAFPEEARPEELLALIDRSKQPFVQYWALRVLNNLVDGTGATAFSPQDLRRLREFEGVFRRGTDRHDQVLKLNRKLGSQ